MAMTQEQYDKVHQYLLDNNQQELAGHLDGLWQELNQLRSEHPQPADRTSAQDFQDQASTPDEPATEDPQQ